MRRSPQQPEIGRCGARCVRATAWAVRFLVVCALLAIAGACNHDPMVDQAKYEPYEASSFFADGASARPRIPGTVSRSELDQVNQPRPPCDHALLLRGQERFNIFCSPCHGRDGYGAGTIVLRGYPIPPSFHDQRLRDVNDDYLYAVIEKGFGKMPPYASSVAPRDRWAVIAYIRALQLSQHAALADVPPAERERLAAETDPSPPAPQPERPHAP